MNCLYCGKQLVKGQTKYCCIKHETAYKRNMKIEYWKAGKDKGYQGTSIKSFIRNYLLDKYGYKCQLCGWGEENPYTHNIPLEIHHKDGNYQNNDECNLQVLCPNCHSLTDTYKSLNRDSRRDDRNKYTNRKTTQRNYCIDCGCLISEHSKRCKKCSNKKNNHRDIPVSRDKLKDMIRTMPFLQISRLFGVTDNAVRKWCLRYGLPKKVKDIKEYSDEEWINI